MTGPATPDAPDVRSSQLLTTLGVAGALAGLLIVFVFEATQPGIQRYKAEVLRLAVQEVLNAPDRYDTLYVYDGALTADLPNGVVGAGLEQVYLGYAGARAVGFAVAAGQPGFQDIIRIIFGYDPATNSLLGMRVLESKETPGLGDKIEKDLEFVSQFNGAEPQLLGVKRGAGSGAAGEIDMITGATISSRTVIKIINTTLERLGPMMTAYGEGGS
jgi:electron transport complex protein RnfG